MRCLVAIAVSAATLATPCSLAAAPDLVEVYTMALGNDPAYAAAKSENEAVMQSVPEARGGLLPNVGLAAEFTETDQEIISSDNEVFGQGKSSFPTDVFTLSITQPIFRWDQIIALRQAKAGVQEAGVRLIAAEQQLILRTATRYLELLAAKDNLDYARAEQDANKRQLDQITRRKEVGFADATELYESSARYEFARSTVAEAISVVEDRIAALLEITGDRIEAVDPLKANLPLAAPDPTDVDQWLAKAMEGNLDLQARMHAVDVSSLEIRRQGAAAYPTLDLLLNSERRNAEGSLFGGGSETETTNILLRLEVPLYQGGQVRARKRAASSRYEQAQHFLEQERRAVQRDTRSAYLGVVNGITRVQALEESVKAQTLTLEAKQKGFVAGTNTNLEVLDAQRDLYLVRRDHAQARYDYLVSLLTLKAEVGTLGLEDLEEVNRYLEDS